MKIISRFKDYYDYLTGIYGVDPLVVYNRQPMQAIYYQNGDKPKADQVMTLDRFKSIAGLVPNEVLYFHVCDKVVPTLLFGDQIYTSEKSMINLYESGKGSEEFRRSLRSLLWNHYGYKTKSYRYELVFYGRQDQVDFNKMFNCPVVLAVPRHRVYDFYLNPKLQEFRIGEVIPPEEMYLQLTQFLSKKDIDMPKDPKDMDRYQAKGFDKKTSFRNM